jgi:hypothetical protein
VAIETTEAARARENFIKNGERNYKEVEKALKPKGNLVCKGKTERPDFRPAFPTHSTKISPVTSPGHRQHMIRLADPVGATSHQFWGQAGDKLGISCE